MNEDSKIAVLTCDIVDSSLLQDLELKQYRQKIEASEDKRILNLPQFYRGDSFQLVTKPEDALDFALSLRIDMKCLHQQNDVRISIGIGQVKTFNENVLLSTGSAFEISGKNLDQLKGWKLNLYIQTDNPLLNDELETYCYFADAILNGISQVQSKVIYYKLQYWGQKEIADILSISQPAVSKSLKTANWQTIERFQKRYKTLIIQNYGHIS